MQSVINSVKGTALGVAEYLTPVLKVICVRFLFSHFIYQKLYVSNLSEQIRYFGLIIVEQQKRGDAQGSVNPDVIDENNEEMNKICRINSLYFLEITKLTKELFCIQ